MRRFAPAALLCLLLAGSCAAYTVDDLPSGWGIDPNRVEGRLLSAYAGGLPGGDPNTWLMPIGDFERSGTTNGWVARLQWVSTGTSDSLTLSHDADTGMSTSWGLDGWVKPGVNYKVFDAFSWPVWTLFVPRLRYTVVVVGVAPEGTEPILE